MHKVGLTTWQPQAAGDIVVVPMVKILLQGILLGPVLLMAGGQKSNNISMLLMEMEQVLPGIGMILVIIPRSSGILQRNAAVG